MTYQRGEIRWIRLDPTVGAEVQKTRPCLIVQNDIMNQYGQLTIVMPFRPGNKKAPYTVNVVPSNVNGLDQDRFIDVAQIRAVDGKRVLGKLGVLESNYWESIKIALDIILGFSL
ncbi:type II toxin-antitoxin system PemK/MazF family toxin [Crocosphaera sp. XPORK-15E]|uniref:type II toxin-antitoxin system PemK/MazF family toxin n=1 Tax=Crocosphaera sp. XPORK-15E TaxID=3110247 RepID=UPI002B20095C|nr:type II toxin-antitoxin system PemK/MazF family toxin [Crocosphaera sp. XPORK-15E]MEA5533064.1 type II toxin-antitoxin system PemK/MazF family toxin [Crocosphaera sp. XPORK-15E]